MKGTIILFQKLIIKIKECQATSFVLFFVCLFFFYFADKGLSEVVIEKAKMEKIKTRYRFTAIA